jgi:hypothetical protein
MTAPAIGKTAVSHCPLAVMIPPARAKTATKPPVAAEATNAPEQLAGQRWPLAVFA